MTTQHHNADQLLAQTLLETVRQQVNSEVPLLRARIAGALAYMEGVEEPNHITLEHVRRYLTGEYDNHLPKES